MSNIVYKSKNAVIVNKPVGIPSQSDSSGDRDMLSLLRDELKSLSERDDVYLIHRLDRVVGGLLVFARNKPASAALSALASSGELGKEYFAVVNGRLSDGEMVDYLYKNAVIGKAVVVDKHKNGAKRAELEYKVVDTASTPKGEISLVRITLKTGRFHQIRAQFSARGHALVGDTKYGGSSAVAKNPALFACRLEFSVLGEYASVSAIPDLNEYPWSLFAPEKYEV